MHTWTLLLSLPLFVLACGDKAEEVDPLTVDDDGDGFTENDGDCNDADPNIKPFGDEICDFFDNDCDGLTDDDDDNLIANSTTTYYADNDRDGYGDEGASVNTCLAPVGYIDVAGDCDDGNADISPDGSEICDEIDNDCDGLIDDEDDSVNASNGNIYYIDADGDGEGSPNDTITSCSLPEGYSEFDTDCNDSAEDLDGNGEADGAAFNNLDEDNDGLTTCGEDTDGDGVIDSRDCADGTAAVGARDDDGDGFISCIDDCDDYNSFTYPGAGYNEADPTACMTDVDGDGWGDMATSGDVSMGTDCDDSDAAKNNSDVDVDGLSACDGDCDDNDAEIGFEDLDGDGFSSCLDDCFDSDADMDMDGVPDSAAVYPGAASMEPTLCTADVDGDGYGDALVNENYNVSGCFMLALVDTGSYWDAADVTVTVNGVIEGSYTNSAASSSGQEELFEVCVPGAAVLNYTCTSTYDCNAHTFRVYLDSNRDGTYDSLVYADGFEVTGTSPVQGDVYTVQLATVDEGSDCNDTDATTIGDDDGDGYTFCTEDCDDTDATVNPDGVEVYYDGVDQDCDGMSDFDQDMDGVDIYEVDCDGDGVADNACDFDGNGSIDWRGGRDCDDADSTTTGDDDGDGFLVCGDDCDDTDVSINPSVAEIYYDGVDQNCVAGDEFDQDGDGDIVDVVDCAGVTQSTCDFDGDGVDDFIGGTDCDDTSSGLNGLDIDTDGFTSCADANGLSDCDDSDANTYPGIAINEPSYDASDLSTHSCATDSDGDGYAAAPPYGCYLIEMTDSYGDGWNGNALEVYENGMWMASFTNENLINGFYTPETETATYCPTSGLVEFMFLDGDFTDEVSFALYYDDGSNGVFIGEGIGEEPSTLTFMSINYGDGDTLFSDLWGSDSDDSDGSVN
jgi:hypothetical protein